MNATIIFDDGSQLSGIVIDAKVDQIFKTSSYNPCPTVSEVTATVKLDIGKLEQVQKNIFKLTQTIK